MKDFMVGNTGTALLVVLGAVGLVLLIAVVNVANLQIARAAARQREMAIRTALGAAWPRLARQLLTESILLGTIGAALGLWLAHRGLLAILALSPDLLPRMNEVAVNGSVLAFTAVVALIASILSGLAPALGTRTSHLDEWLKQGGRSDTSGASSRLIHNILVVLEFSLALVLLTGAGLLLRSLSRLEAVSPGFEPAHILTAQISLPPMRYASAEQVTSFYRQLLNEISGTPGVTSAGLTMSLPPNLLEVMNPFHLEGQPYTLDKAVSLAEEIPISDNYFRALGTPLIAGRFFDDEDRTPGRHSMIVNLTMAQNYFSSRAVGQELQTGDANPQSTWYTIVGVVGDVKYQGLAAKDQPTMYVPTYDDGWNPWFTRSMSLVVRSPENPDHLASALRESVASLDRDVPLSKIQTMDDLMSQSVGEPRFWTVLLATFAVLALVLAAIGIYGVTSYSVTRRTHEIGIMIALGAQPNDVLKVILSQGARLALFGAAVGMAAAFAVTRVMSSLLFGVSATDPLTLAGVAILLVFVALLACYVPARRAMRVDPMVALRYE
jgi:putative ABC transport system permease protein